MFKPGVMTKQQMKQCASEIRQMLTDHGDHVVGNLRGNIESLCDAVLFDGEKRYVNVYLVNRLYGGPEEGGWWYEAGEVIDTRCCDSEMECLKVKQELATGEYSNEGRAPLSSMHCTGVYWIRVEGTMGKDFPKDRPHYE